MTRLCTVCTHPQREQIDAALLEHIAGYRGIAGRFGVNDTSLQRHAETHLRELIQHSKELRRMLAAGNLAAQLGKWHERMEAQYAKADQAGNILGAMASGRPVYLYLQL
jgi:hypothetical protein